MSNYNKFGVNTSNSFNTPPKAGSSKLFKQLIDMGYTDQTKAIIAINAYLLTGKFPNPTTKGKV